VVADPFVVGLILHEALGHASEGDIVATGGSVLAGKRGEMIASELVTIVDEGVVEGGYYLPFDDEGVEKGRTMIVDRGRLTGYLTDRQAAHKMEAETTGNGRAEDFESMPLVRQSNYYMLEGDMTMEELIEDMDYGLLIQGKGTRGGQVDPGQGTFTFGVGPSKIIEKGKLGELVRGVVISGSILETLKTVDGVGDKTEIRTSVFGGCGKGGQQVTVGMGGPHVRIGKMTIGGRAE
jgi:TldD protein